MIALNTLTRKSAKTPAAMYTTGSREKSKSQASSLFSIMPAPISFSSDSSTVHRKCAHCEAVEKQIQRKEKNGEAVFAAPSIVTDVINSSSGSSLDEDTRSFMEPRFGYNFSNVKIHADSHAAKSAQSINALAYSHNEHVVFGPGQYNPRTTEGKILLAHELVHVVQQKGSSVSTPQRLSSPADTAEVEAHSISENIIKGGSQSRIQTSASLNSNVVSLQLDPQKVYCALHAAVCLGLSENPPAAALCWANFAQRCSGAMASTGESEQGEAVASETPANSEALEEGMG